MKTYNVTFYCSVEIQADNVEDAARKYDQLQIVGKDAEYVDLNYVEEINENGRKDVTTDFEMVH